MMSNKIQNAPVFISESEVKSILTWPLVNRAVEEALKSICNTKSQSDQSLNNNQSYANQPARSITTTTEKNGAVLLAMPGFVANYELFGQKFNTLGCKLVTMANNNEKNIPPIPNILANIMLFDELTGRLKCIMEATEITAWRTASASIVSTKYLYFKRKEFKKPIVAIIGCGVQGRSHSIGFCHTFDIDEIRLYNRNYQKAEILLKELILIKETFLNQHIKITICSSIAEAVANADIIVTATFSSDPLIELDMLKHNVHINAIGAGAHHHSELSKELYLNCSVYVDNWTSAKTELKELNANIVGEVGEVIIDETKIPENGITVFQSMGMAIEDVTVAQSVWEVLHKK